MSSLYNRAGPAQARILRIVEGACINAAHAHPGAVLDRRLARSVAKRAAGTLSACWPELAALGPSENGDVETSKSARYRLPHLSKATGRGASQLTRRFPLRLLISEISRQIGTLKRAGQTARAEALIDVLRIIDRVRAPPSRSSARMSAGVPVCAALDGR